MSEMPNEADEDMSCVERLNGLVRRFADRCYVTCRK